MSIYIHVHKVRHCLYLKGSCCVLGFLHTLKVVRRYAYETSSVIELELLISTTLELINNTTAIVCYQILSI